MSTPAQPPASSQLSPPDQAGGPFQNRLAVLFRARFPFLYLSTFEEARALTLIRQVANNGQVLRAPRKVFVWAATTGMMEAGRREQHPGSAPPLKALEFIESSPDPAVFVLKDFHHFLGGKGRTPDPVVLRKIRDLGPVLKGGQVPRTVIFLSPELQIPPDLQKEFDVLELPLPGFHEIQELLFSMIRANVKTGRVKVDLKSEEAELLVKAALGLTLVEAENAFARAMVEDGMLNIADLEVILEEKRQVIRKSEILEFISTDVAMADVGGLENLKRWMTRRNRSWMDAARAYSLPNPKGILLTGVPGCGKSMIAKALAATWRLPLLRLDVGRIFAGIVGSSEENMRRALATAEAIAPSVLWIDEIEKGFSGAGGSGSGDSGTSQRVFGTFLTWMQEKTAPVFVAATANNISGLPPEMMRKGRFDEIFFVDLPTVAERRAIFHLHLGKRLTNPEVLGALELNDALYGDLAAKTEGFVGAEIEQVVISALFEAFAETRAITKQDLDNAIAATVPLSVTQAEQIQSLRSWAKLRAVSATAPQDREGYADDDNGGDLTATRGGRTLVF